MYTRIFNKFKNASHKYEQKLKDAANGKNTIDYIFGVYDAFWSNPATAFLPQYQYIVKPMYIMFGGKTNPLISVPATFIVTDFILHQILGKLIECNLSKEITCESLMQINIAQTAVWFALSLPIAIYKYKLSHQETTLTDNVHKISALKKQDSVTQVITQETNDNLFFAKNFIQDVSICNQETVELTVTNRVTPSNC